MIASRQKIAQQYAELLNQGCVIIDFETTGFVSATVEIVEVAILNHHGEILLDTTVKTQRPIPSDASRIHGIYDHDVADSPTFIGIYARLLRHLSGQPVVAYNYTFEEGILAAVTRQYGLALQVKDWRCAMRDYATYSGRGRWCSLGEACTGEGITVSNAHRALGDCRMTLALMPGCNAGQQCLSPTAPL